jgi:hypothetical protein
LKVATSPDFLQSVIDHPQVKPWVAPDGVTDVPLEKVFADGIALEFETGGFFFHRLGDGVYEVHTLFLPGTKNALACCKASAHFLFCATDCLRIVTKVPQDNIAADRLTRRMGFRHDYTRESAYLRGGVMHDVAHYSLGLDDWLRGQGPGWFVEQCNALGQPDKGRRAAFRWAVMNDEMEKASCP